MNLISIMTNSESRITQTQNNTDYKDKNYSEIPAETEKTNAPEKESVEKSDGMEAIASVVDKYLA